MINVSKEFKEKIELSTTNRFSGSKLQMMILV